MNNTLVFPADTVASVVRIHGVDATMDELISRSAAAFRGFDPEEFVIPTRSGFQYNTPVTGLVEWMPLMQCGSRVMMKIVGYHPDNPGRFQLPTILSTFAMFDVATGHMLALTDGTILTCLRTGAASVVASQALARVDSSTLGLIGAGAQAMSQLHALSRVFPIRKVLVYDADVSVAASLVIRVASLEIPSVSIDVVSLDQVLASADILCTATSVEVGKGPVFPSSLACKAHLHINAVGADLPGKIEVPLDHLARSYVCPDFLAQAQVEGECQQLAGEQIGADLSTILKSPDSYEKCRDGLTVFDSTGFALEDYIAFEWLLEKGLELKMGVRMKLEGIPVDPHNPYEFLLAGLRADQEVCLLKK